MSDPINDDRVYEVEPVENPIETGTSANLDVAAINSVIVAERLRNEDFPAMQSIIGQTNADLRADPSQELKALARANRRLIRMVAQLLTGTE